MKKSFLIIITFLFLTTIFAGCGQSTQPAAQNNPDGKYRIVTSFYPIYITTANITKGIDNVKVINMTKPQTGCLHDYQLTTDDMKTLETANAFVANGAGMETFLEKAIQAHSGMKLIDASKDIQLLTNDGEKNPHVWLSITNAIKQTENIANQLAEADPQHADAYKANATAYIDKLKTLQTELHAQLDSLPHRDIITFHEAFPYFAQEFNIHIIKVVEREPGTEPTPKELQSIIEDLNNLPVKTIFVEPQYSPSCAETISRETGAKIFTLDPIVTGEANEQALNAYITTMRQNATTLQEALK